MDSTEMGALEQGIHHTDSLGLWLRFAGYIHPLAHNGNTAGRRGGGCERPFLAPHLHPPGGSKPQVQHFLNRR